MDNIRRYFVQFMLKNGCVTLKRATDYYAFLQESHENEEPTVEVTLTDLVKLINKHICKQDFKIVFATCEVTKADLVIFTNTKNDAISKMQVAHTAVELEYFQTIMTEIVESDEHRLPHMNCLNMASSLQSSLQRSAGQDLIEKWIKDGYLVIYDDHVYLGARAVQEFKSYFQTQCKDYILNCNLCLEPVFLGRQCNSCEQIVHLNCLEKFTRGKCICPNCKSDLDETEPMESQSSAENTRHSKRLKKN